MFCFTKDNIPTLQKSNNIYGQTCPGCNENCTEKKHNLATCLHEHDS